MSSQSPDNKPDENTSGLFNFDFQAICERLNVEDEQIRHHRDVFNPILLIRGDGYMQPIIRTDCVGSSPPEEEDDDCDCDECIAERESRCHFQIGERLEEHKGYITPNKIYNDFVCPSGTEIKPPCVQCVCECASDQDSYIQTDCIDNQYGEEEPLPEEEVKYEFQEQIDCQEEEVYEYPNGTFIEEVENEENTWDCPQEEIITDCPQQEEIVPDCPQEEIILDCPQEEVVPDCPEEEETMNDCPEEEIVNDCPEEEIVNDCPQEESVPDCPQEEEIVKDFNQEPDCPQECVLACQCQCQQEEIVVSDCPEDVVNECKQEVMVNECPEE